MNLKQLQYFCEVVEAGSAAKAAQTLFVAPTAISMRIAQLEEEIGGPLFDRAARPMPLTALGRFVHPCAQELLAQAHRLESDARRVASARAGWLGIGFARSAMLSLLPTAIRSFRSRCPDVRLDMAELLSEHQPAQIEAGKIHLGIARHVGPATAAPPGCAMRAPYSPSPCSPRCRPARRRRNPPTSAWQNWPPCPSSPARAIPRPAMRPRCWPPPRSAASPWRYSMRPWRSTPHWAWSRVGWALRSSARRSRSMRGQTSDSCQC